MITITRIPIDDLYHRGHDDSVHFVWDDNPQEGYEPETEDASNLWTFWEAVICPACNYPTRGQGVCNTEGCDNEGDYLDSGHGVTRDGPVMNWYYPFDGEPDEDEAARKIVDLPLCLVKVGDTYGLALTGGGMDMSWEVAEAFTRLGMYPPAYLSLPKLAGMTDSERNTYIVAALRASIESEIRMLSGKLSDLDRTSTWLTES